MIAKFDGLEKLTIKGCGYHSSPRKYTLYQQTFHSLFANAVKGDILSNLQTLELNLEYQDTWFCQMEAYKHLPRLKRLAVLGAGIHSFRVQNELICSSPLEELSVYSCDISSSGLINMLAIRRALKSLTFKGIPLSARLPLYLESIRQPYINGIEQHAESLHTLDIDFCSHPATTAVP
ncbi:hypothetical protein BDV19DRAFT_390545 [Aspergillus venezuelensis]